MNAGSLEDKTINTRVTSNTKAMAQGPTHFCLLKNVKDRMPNIPLGTTEIWPKQFPTTLPLPLSTSPLIPLFPLTPAAPLTVHHDRLVDHFEQVRRGEGRSQCFSAPALLTSGARSFFCCGDCSVYSGILSGISDLHPLEASRTTSLSPTYDNQKWLQTLPNAL